MSKRNRSSIRSILVVALALSFSQSAWSAVCNVSTSPVSFGLYWGTTALTSTGWIDISCDTPGTLIQQIQFNGGLYGTAGTNTRQMSAGGTATIRYNYYSDATYSQILGDGTNGTTTLTNAVGGPTASRIQVFGQIPAGQVVPPGTYSDTVLVTIVY